MKSLIIGIIMLGVLIMPVSAMEFTAPTPPEGAMEYMPQEQETFAQGLWYIIKTAIFNIKPEIEQAAGVSILLVGAVLLMSILEGVSKEYAGSVRLTGAVIIGLLLLEPANAMVKLSAGTVVSLSEYGKLLLPVLTAAVAAQGGASTSVALYSGTVFFNTLLTSAISKLIVPAVYVFLSISIVSHAFEQDMLGKLKASIKWAITWGLKIVLYIFTGYISITGVISGAVDASALKAAKLTISGMVPVIGGILSDASETILVSAEMMKNAAGVYGVFAILAICIGPFLQIGIQYLLLKLSCAICNIFGYKPAVGLIEDFSTGMGMVLAMTGTVCMLLLISMVCFLKGMSG